MKLKIILEGRRKLLKKSSRVSNLTLSSAILTCSTVVGVSDSVEEFSFHPPRGPPPPFSARETHSEHYSKSPTTLVPLIHSPIFVISQTPAIPTKIAPTTTNHGPCALCPVRASTDAESRAPYPFIPNDFFKRPEIFDTIGI